MWKVIVLKQAYRFSPEAGCFLMWSITFICCWFGANIWKRAPLRLRWYMVLNKSCALQSLHCDILMQWWPLWYSLYSLMDISSIPPATSRENLDGRSGSQNAFTIYIYIFYVFFQTDLVSISFTYHCNISISPVAIVPMVDKAGRLARKNRQCLFWKQSPGCQHGSASISLFQERNNSAICQRASKDFWWS